MRCKQVSLSIGALLGNLEGIRLPGLLERKDSMRVSQKVPRNVV
jgi:hypothetical protein